MHESEARGAVRDLVARHALGFAVNFAGTIYLARALGPAAWGAYAVAYATQLIAQSMLERGTVGSIIQRRHPAGPADIGTILLVQFLAGLAFGCGVALAAQLAVPAFGEPALAALLLAVAVSLPVYAVRAVPMGILERRLGYRAVGVVEIADLATFNVVAAAGVATGLGLLALAPALLTRAIVSLTVAWLLAAPAIAARLNLLAARELATFAVPYTLSHALGYLNGAAAPLLVGTIAGTRAFGVLQLAYSLIAYPQALSAIIGRVALPVFSRGAEHGTDIAEATSRGTALLIRFVGTGMIVLAVSSPAWIPVVYGAQWSEASAVMLAIAPALGLGTALTLTIAALNAAGRTRVVLAVNALFSASYWAGAVLLVPGFGALGLPVAYAIASISFLIYVVAFRRTFASLRIRSALVELTLGGVACAVAAVAMIAGAPPLLYLVLAAIAAVSLLRTGPRALSRQISELASLR